MRKYVWQFLAVGLVVGGLGTVQAASSETANYSTGSTAPAMDASPKGKKHRRAEGTNRSSRPGTTTGVHGVNGVDTPAQMGVKQNADGSVAPAVSTTTY